MVSLTYPDSGIMLPPPTPETFPKLYRTSIKRDSSHLSDSSELLSPKRLQVSFVDTPDIKHFHHRARINENDKDYAEIKSQVRLAIVAHLAPAPLQNDELYLILLHIIKEGLADDADTTPNDLINYLIALESEVEKLGDCGKLVLAAISQEWLGRDDIFVAMYIKFMVSVASSYPKFLVPALERLMACFSETPVRSQESGLDPISETQMLERAHVAIKALLRHIPAASNVLMRVVKQEYPGESSVASVYYQYQQHLLKIGEYAHQIKNEIIAVIVQRLVLLDVDIQAEIQKLEEGEEDEDDEDHEDNELDGVRQSRLQRLFSQEAVKDDGEGSDDESDAGSVISLSEDEQHDQDLRVKIAKIDATMDLLFDYYGPQILDGSPADGNEAYSQLLSHFSTYIMPSRTRHAQFLVFHFSQTSSDHVTMFAEQCIQQGFGQVMSAERFRAIAYLASFIARGSHIRKDIVQSIFLVLAEYMEQMRQRYEPTCRAPDRRAYALYYAIAQALLYIFCFRWRDLVMKPRQVDDEESGDESEADDILEDQGELQWLSGMKDKMQKNIFSALNPLKVCAPDIVAEFADISRHVRFIEVLSKLESNKRLRLGSIYPRYDTPSQIDIGRRETAIDRKTGDSHHQLDPYFPFDPYFLPNSKRWVDGYYNEWKPPRGMKQSDDNNDHVNANEDSEDESDLDSDLEQAESGVLETISISS